MNHIKHMWRCNILFLLALGGCCHAWAQVAFIATPSSGRIGIKDQVQLDFVVRNVENLEGIRTNGFGDFTPLQGPYPIQSFNIENGVRSVSFRVSYIVKPNKVGKLTIPPASAKDNAGHVYQSNAITIEVVPGSLAPQQPRRPANQKMMDEDDDPLAQFQQQMAQFEQLQAQVNRLQNAYIQQMQRARQMQPMPQARGAQPLQPQSKSAPAAPAIDEAQLKKDIFVRVVVDKSKVHVGEQITASYKLYSRIPFEAGLNGLPDLNGFWVEYFDIPQPKPTIEVVDGKKYQVFLIKKLALFPQQAGALELDPVEIKGAAKITQQVRRRVADDFVNPFTGTLMMNDPVFNNAYYDATVFRDVPITLKNPPVKINVSALPDNGQPEEYGGAVGKFTAEAKLDKKELTTDDVATLTLTISGSGNIKFITPPKLHLPSGINTYDPVVVDTITGRSTTISGSKILSYAITPQTPGDYEIPSVPFTYFDANAGKYVTINTAPIKVHITPGKHYNPTKPTENISVTRKDINGNATKSLTDLQMKNKPLLESPGYWSLYALPVLAFVGLLVWRKKSDEHDDTMIRHKKANKIALQRLMTAKKLLAEQNKTSFHEEVSKAIWLYLSDKLHIPLSALSRDTARAAFAERKVPQVVQQQFEDVIWECETALYATGGKNDMSHTYEAAMKVISDLEGVI
ncbi:hypothetical protein CJD36_000085 [Flavipsychrobacter stenotrophus]|uniref:Protein BatD n=1 Tax=Flavipsychrobacter stenotrophus TaxID=2077091 RepID=A0A2S7T044_9BACT|nr:BatD family protein [Flavipsychrobacter stenotrophus]PQJ12195.1 hypothetical protein CJD36_000085 [Flavipsychrobacter stenotrophus]